VKNTLICQFSNITAFILMYVVRK